MALRRIELRPYPRQGHILAIRLQGLISMLVNKVIKFFLDITDLNNFFDFLLFLRFNLLIFTLC